MALTKEYYLQSWSKSYIRHMKKALEEEKTGDVELAARSRRWARIYLGYIREREELLSHLKDHPTDQVVLSENTTSRNGE